MRAATLKTMGVSIGSALFTMVLVLACSAGAGKLGADDSSDPSDDQYESEDLGEDDDQSGSGGDDESGEDFGFSSRRLITPATR